MEHRIKFAESPRSPYRRVRSRRSLSPMEQPVIISRKCERVGCLSAVNQQLSEEGLLRVLPPNPLVSEATALRQQSRTLSSPIPRIKQKELVEVAEEEEVKEAALVELAVFPGFSHYSATSLPHRLDALQLMKLIVKVQTHLQCKPRFIMLFEEMFFSEASQEILKDMFWWYFLHRYQPNQTVKDCFFSRISDNYIKLLIHEAKKQLKDLYFQLYPDILAQSVYSAFIRAYPASWNSFDDSNFRTELCNIIYLWFTGTKPILEHWKKWDFHALEPAELMKVMGGKDDSPRSSHKAFNLDRLLKQASEPDRSSPANSSVTTLNSSPEIGLKQDQTKEEPRVVLEKHLELRRKGHKGNMFGGKSTQVRFRKMPWMRSCEQHSVLPLETIEEPRFEHCIFDAFGTSPLVLHFLERQQLVTNNGYSCLLQRTEISYVPPRDSPTYHHVLNASRSKSSETSKQFMRCYFTMKQHMHQFNSRQREATLQHEHEIRMLLSNRHERQGLSSIITFTVLSDNTAQARKRNIAKAIHDSLQRLSSPPIH